MHRRVHHRNELRTPYKIRWRKWIHSLL